MNFFGILNKTYLSKTLSFKNFIEKKMSNYKVHCVESLRLFLQMHKCAWISLSISCHSFYGVKMILLAVKCMSLLTRLMKRSSTVPTDSQSDLILLRLKSNIFISTNKLSHLHFCQHLRQRGHHHHHYHRLIINIH